MKKSEALRLIGEEIRLQYIQMNSTNNFNMEQYAVRMLKLFEKRLHYQSPGYLGILSTEEKFDKNNPNHNENETGWFDTWEPEGDDGS